jgi:preprotein translocase subunit SecA
VVLQKLLRMGEGRRLRQLEKRVAGVNALEDRVSALTDEQLRARTQEFRDRLARGETLDDLMAEAFATVRETAQRTLGQRHFDVQVVGAIALHDGDIAEMKTGEGKTLTSTMPLYLNALGGSPVHVVTVNPYLASRDAEWMGRIFGFLGLSVGLVYSRQPREEKRAAYAADITYGTNNEFGFDFLRDHMVVDPAEKVQRGHGYAIVDEVDSILIDEARTPLIISGPVDQATEWYQVFAKRVAPKLVAETDYEVDEAKRTVAVTEQGVAKVEQLLGVANLYESVNTPLIQHLQNALKAKELFRRDDEYVIEDGEVHIVDEHTGRILYGRRYSEGLHQAIEAKEGVAIKEENQTLATITLQNYYRTYDKLAGMTGTAKTEEAEFTHIYDMEVVQVPTNEPVIRVDAADQIYQTLNAKLDAVVGDVAARHEAGQPVLLGTASVEKSEEVSERLRKQGVPHEVLNAKNHFREAAIIAQAGRVGAVTVATNMAGRGVDIMLGGNPEALADDLARTRCAANGIDPDGDVEAYAGEYAKALEETTAQCRADGDQVRELGGLYVCGTERHESRRIDNQLRGRSGRQGDPGESRFFLSLEDDLMRLFNASAVESIMNKFNLPEDQPIEAKMVSKAVQRAQTQVESRNFEIRKNVLQYDDVMNKQRQVIYDQRDTVLEGSDEAVGEIAEDFIEDALRDKVTSYAPQTQFPEEWELDELLVDLGQLYPTQVTRESLGELDDLDQEGLIERLLQDAFDRYEEREHEVGAEVLRQVERRVILSVVDRLWREHLYEMDHLRDGIGLRAVGQRDPLVEYQREAYDTFSAMMARIKEESTGYFFNLPVHVDSEGGQAGSAPGQADGDDGDRQPAGQVARPALRDDRGGQPADQRLSYTSAEDAQAATGTATATLTPASSASGAPPSPREVAKATQGTAVGETVRRDDKVGRNDPCPCGSGLKHKRCCAA